MVDLAHEQPINSNYTANSIELKNYEEIENEFDREYLETKLKKGYKDYNFDIKKIPGHWFQSNSGPSLRIAQNKSFLDTIKSNKQGILNNEEVSGNFPIDNSEKSNLHFAIGHYDLRNGYLDKRGNLHIQMYDTYDFNKNNHTPLNQAGRNQMLKGNLKPYFTIHDIIVPNYVIDEIWR